MQYLSKELVYPDIIKYSFKQENAIWKLSELSFNICLGNMAPGNEAEWLDMLTISNKKTVQELRKKKKRWYLFVVV